LNKYNEYIDKKSKFVTREDWLIKYNKPLYNLITKIYSNDIPFKEKVYQFRFKLKKTPICKQKNCNENVKFLSYTSGYRNYCSIKCHSNCDKIKSNRKKTNQKKYGFDHPMKSKKVQDKLKLFFNEKYGVDNPFQSDNIKLKIKKTNEKKYGFDNPNKNKLIRGKIEKTNLIKYGHKTTLLNNVVNNKIKESKLKAYLLKWCKFLGITIDNITVDGENLIIKNLCEIHGEFVIDKKILYSRIFYDNKNYLCTGCNPVNKFNSFGQLEMRDYIIDLGFNIEENNRKVLNGKEIDILIKEKNIGIEYNGLYHHSDLFKPDDYHFTKTNLAVDKNIDLIHIFEDEWQNKKETVKSLIKSKFNIFDVNINANECNIRKVNNNFSLDFFKENNLEFLEKPELLLGLYYNSELVLMMNMKKTSSENEYELDGFCIKNNYNIIGGASKLFRYFLKFHKPKKIISYLNRRYDNGKTFDILGFTKKKIVKPNYEYIVNKKRENKSKFLNHDYPKIYDSGKIMYVYE
jgi:hypothetical protein